MKRLQEQRQALGSQALFTVVLEDDTEAATVFDRLWAITADFEHRFSRFLPSSELTQFNSQAGEKVVVSSEFEELLATCQAMSRTTDGLFNPFILPSLNKAGYIGSWPETNTFSKALNYERRAERVSSTELQLGAGWAKIPTSAALDFGGIGKGFLLDKLGDYLTAQDIDNFWLSLGGDILCSGHDVDASPWSIAIQLPPKTLNQLTLLLVAATRFWGLPLLALPKRKGVHHALAWHHIIDPRTGKPASTDILTATVSANTATEADVLAKCAVILGSTETEAFVARHNLRALYLQLSNGHSQVLTAKTEEYQHDPI